MVARTRAMRLASRISLIFLILLAAYTVWPFYDLYRIARIIERRDVVALSRHIELRTLRGSLSRQVLGTYLRISGQEASLGKSTSDLVAGVSVSVAESSMAEYGSAERLIELFAEGWPSDERTRIRKLALFPRTLETAWKLYLNSEYSFGHFYVSAPVAAPPKQRFRLQLQLKQWTWKLSDIQLPEELRMRLAQEIVKVMETKRSGGGFQLRR